MKNDDNIPISSLIKTKKSLDFQLFKKTTSVMATAEWPRNVKQNSSFFNNSNEVYLLNQLFTSYLAIEDINFNFSKKKSF